MAVHWGGRGPGHASRRITTQLSLLFALALDDTSVPEDSAATINITGATSGSTITVQSGSLPSGMTLNSGARTISGTPPTAGSSSFTLRETLADSPNSPRDTALSITISAAAATYDYYIDDTLGDDADPGSEAAPWQSLNKINSIALGAGATVSVLVKATSTYDKATDYIKRTDSSGGGAIGAGSTLNITFESGCTMDGTAISAISPENGLEFDGAAAHTTNVISLAAVGAGGLIVQNYNSTSGGASANGVSNRGNNTLNVSNVRVTGCIDGFSAHNTATMNLLDCEADECIKSPFIHVGTAVITAERCLFTEKSGGGTAEMDITDTTSTVDVTCTECEFIPDGTSSRMRAGGVTFIQCEVGDLDSACNIQWTSGQAAPVFTKCFVNTYIDGSYSATMTECFGKFGHRVRSGGTQIIEYNSFTGPASAQTAMISGTTDQGNDTLVFNNNIVETATAAAFMNVNGTAAPKLAAGGAQFQYNCLSGSAAFDADYISADSGGTGRTGTITADALIGAGNTLAMTDYAFASGSPCIGAGEGGTDIGFGSGEVVTVGVP